MIKTAEIKTIKTAQTVWTPALPFLHPSMPRTIDAMHQHMLTQHDFRLTRGEISQLMTAPHPIENSPIVQHLKHRMEAERLAQGYAHNNLENQKAVSETQQQAMRDHEREPCAAVSAQLAAAFAIPRVKESFPRLASHKQALENLIRRKWTSLQSSERHFGLDRTRNYPVLVKVPLLQDMGLSCLRFIPGTLPFPSIIVSVELGAVGSFRVALIDGKLASVPPHIRRVLSEAGLLFLTLAVVVHYIDLFIVTEQQTAHPVSPRQVGDDNSTVPSRSRNVSSFVRIRTIPRQERTRVVA